LDYLHYFKSLEAERPKDEDENGGEKEEDGWMDTNDFGEEIEFS
jgi:hypothetical protein